MPSRTPRGKGRRRRPRQLGRPSGARRRPVPTFASRVPIARSATWLLLIPCWWGLLLAASADPAGLSWFDLWIATGCGHRCLPDARRRVHLERPRPTATIDAQVARTRSRPLPSGQVTPAAGRRLDGRPGGRRLHHPAQLPALGCGARRGLAGPGGDLSLRQALHLVAAGLPRPRLQLGRAAWLGRATRDASGCGAASALRRRHRLDAVLRHDLRPPGPRGRRSDRGAVPPRACSERAPSRVAGQSSSPPPPFSPFSPCSPPTSRRPLASPPSPGCSASPATSGGSSGVSTSTTARAAWRCSARTAAPG